MSITSETKVRCEHCSGTGEITLSIGVFFFGCFEEPGHFWRNVCDHGPIDTNGIERWVPEALRHGRIDTGFCPGVSHDIKDRRAGKRLRPEVEGEARLTHIGGWTVLGWWDRSRDPRGACNSNLIAEFTHDFTTMLEIGRLHIPLVMNRQRQPIRLIESEVL